LGTVRSVRAMDLAGALVDLVAVLHPFIVLQFTAAASIAVSPHLVVMVADTEEVVAGKSVT